MEFVSWSFEFPNILKNTCSKPPTSCKMGTPFITHYGYTLINYKWGIFNSKLLYHGMINIEDLLGYHTISGNLTVCYGF